MPENVKACMTLFSYLRETTLTSFWQPLNIERKQLVHYNLNMDHGLVKDAAVFRWSFYDANRRDSWVRQVATHLWSSERSSPLIASTITICPLKDLYHLDVSLSSDRVFRHCCFQHHKCILLDGFFTQGGSWVTGTSYHKSLRKIMKEPFFVL